MKNKYFILQESEYFQNHYFIGVTIESAEYFHGNEGSFGVLPARLLNLDYCSFLRMCRDLLGAILVGKGTAYVTPYFEDKNSKSVKFLLEVLNERMEYVVQSLKKGITEENEDMGYPILPFDFPIFFKEE